MTTVAAGASSSLIFPKYHFVFKRPPPLKGMSFDEAIVQKINNIEKNSEGFFWHDAKDPKFSDLVVMYDAFPKARYHLLILPRDCKQFNTLRHLKNDEAHIDLIHRMEQLSSLIIKHIQQSDPSVEFKVGFHSVPSMKPIHLHLISTDYVSDCLKTVKHWNSFTTSFLVHPSLVIKALQQTGTVNFASNEHLLKQELTCPTTKLTFKNMQQLKTHLSRLDATKSTAEQKI